VILTPAQIEELRQIIRQASTALAITTTGLKVTPEQMKALVEAGFIDPKESHNIILNSYELGRLMSRLPQLRGMSWQTAKEELQKKPVPLTESETMAYELAASRAGQYCVGLGNRFEGDVISKVVRISEDVANETRELIQDKTAQAVVERRARSSLRTALRQSTEDWARDWDRIAATEMHLSHQGGFLEDQIKRNGKERMMAKQLSPRACDACRDLYLGEDGKPLIKPAAWWREQGETNAGRKKAAWRPASGAAHPWCRCQLVAVPDGWEFDDKGDLVPRGMQKSLDPLQKGQGRKLHYRTTYRGLPISIENRKGSIRRWNNPHNKTEGETKMENPYGYIRLTEGTDGDHVDVFLGDNTKAKFAYVIHQMKAPDFKEPDEDKIMLGFSSRAEAKEAYLAHYDDPRFFGSMTSIPFDEFKEKLVKQRGEMIKGGQFTGTMGLMATDRPHVESMGNYGQPARTTIEASKERDTRHPASIESQKKRKRRRFSDRERYAIEFSKITFSGKPDLLKEQPDHPPLPERDLGVGKRQIKEKLERFKETRRIVFPFGGVTRSEK
jgi:hypothetical protein